MIKKTLYIFVIILAVVAALFYNVYRNRDTKNGFHRKLTNIDLNLITSISTPEKMMFAGKVTNNIALTDYKNKNHLFIYDYSLKLIENIDLDIPSTFKTLTNVYKGRLRNKIYLTNPFSEVATFDNGFLNSYKISNIRFDFFSPISNNTLIARARTFDGNRDRQLVKLNLSNGAKNIRAYTIPKQIDGFFCNDGWLHYDEMYSRIVYMYFYHGTFLCLDTNLNIKFKAKTIDTVTKADLHTALHLTKNANGKPDMQLVQSSPPKFINRYITTNRDRIYVLSGLKADNESLSTFNKNQPIDVYSLDNGKYLYSFYIPKFDGQKLTVFDIKDNMVFAIFGNNVTIFKSKKQL